MMINPPTVPDAPPITVASSIGRFLRRALSYFQRKFRVALWKAQALFDKHRCNVCGKRVGHFLPLAATHPGTVESMQKQGFSFQLETCNYRDYSCPFCSATDRDR